MTQTQPPGLGAEICAALELSIGNPVRELAAELKARNAPPQQPALARIPVNATAPASGLVILTWPECPQGFRMDCLALAVGGLSPLTTAAGRVDVFVTRQNLAQFSGAANELQIGLADWVDWSATLPATAFYSPDQNPVQEGESLVAVISSATAAQVYVANALFRLTQLAAIPQVQAL